MTNKEFAKTAGVFLAACNWVAVLPTHRQASKYRNGKGRAFGPLPARCLTPRSPKNKRK